MKPSQEVARTSIPAGRLLLLAAATEGGLGLAACLLGPLVGQQPWQGLRGSATDGALGAVATVPLLATLAVVMHAGFRPLESIRRAMAELVAPLFGQLALWQLALVAALAGWGEETLFRGLVQPALADFTHQLWIGIAGAAVAFGLAHPLSRAYVAAAAVVGAYLGLLAWWRGNLLAPIVAHGLYDWLALVYLARWYRPRGAAPLPVTPGRGDGGRAVS